MYCTNCGANLPDDSVFCSKCGNKVKVPEPIINIPEQVENTPLEYEKAQNELISEAPNVPIDDAEVLQDDVIKDEIPVTEPEPAAEPDPVAEPEIEIIEPAKKKVRTFPSFKAPKKKVILLVSVGVLAVALIAGIVALLLNGGGSQGVKAEPAVIYAKMTDDGKAYIPLMDGSFVTINEEVDEAAISQDKKSIVVLLQDGTLYVTTPSLEEKHSIADNCKSISSIKNDGFLYKDEDNNVFRVLFADYSKLKLGEDVAATVAANTITVLYATDDGDIFTMAANSTEKQKVGTYNDTIELEAISDNGQISVWVTEKNDVQTIILHDGEDKFTLGEVDYKTNYTYVTFSADQKMVAVTNSYSDRMWIKSIEQDPITVKLGADPYTSTIYTNAGYLEDTLASNVSSLYIATEGDSGANVYNVTLNGDRERVVSKVNDFIISNGKIFYLNKDNTLYCGKLNGSSIEEEEKIASDVDLFEVSQNGQYVYYLKDGNKSGSLYCYKVGTEDAKKITSDAACYIGSYFSDMYITISTDGATVWFMKDLEEIDGTYSDQGTLMMWSYGDESATRVASEVVNFSVTSGLDSVEVNKNSFIFLKYTSVDSDDNIFGNWMYFNGKEASRFATDVIK